MRDVLVVVFLLVAAVYAFKRPYLGVVAWLWISLAAPTNYAFGFSQVLRPNLMIVIVTVIAFAVSRKELPPRYNTLFSLVILFCIWTLITSFAADQSDLGIVLGEWLEFFKIVLLFVSVVLMFRTPLQINTLIWAIVLSVSAYAAMEGVKFLLSAGGHRIEGRAGRIADRNDLAVAINMCLPLIVYLATVTPSRLVKYGLWVLLGLNLIACVGTYSRGGFIGLAILAFAVWLSSRHKIVLALALVLAAPIAYQFTPENWRARQATISSADEDGSFVGRLWAWKISTMIANDNPFTGGGFDAVTTQSLWNYYAPATPGYGMIETPPIPVGKAPKAAHNIYFQVLGDHGWVGLMMFLAMLWSCFVANWRNSRLAVGSDALWYRSLAKAINLSLVGYAITGANVSLAYFDLLYALIGVVVVMTLWRTELTQADPGGSLVSAQGSRYGVVHATAPSACSGGPRG